MTQAEYDTMLDVLGVAEGVEEKARRAVMAAEEAHWGETEMRIVWMTAQQTAIALRAAVKEAGKKL